MEALSIGYVESGEENSASSWKKIFGPLVFRPFTRVARVASFASHSPANRPNPLVQPRDTTDKLSEVAAHQPGVAADERSEVREELGDGDRCFGKVEGERGAQMYWKYIEHRSRPRRSQNGGILAFGL